MLFRSYTTVPNVQCLFYHTKQGAKNLAFFEKLAQGAWRWAGNECRTEVWFAQRYDDGSAVRITTDV